MGDEIGQLSEAPLIERQLADATTDQSTCCKPRGKCDTLDAAADVIDGLHALNQTCIQTGFDNIRNMVGNPDRKSVV